MGIWCKHSVDFDDATKNDATAFCQCNGDWKINDIYFDEFFTRLM